MGRESTQIYGTHTTQFVTWPDSSYVEQHKVHAGVKWQRDCEETAKKCASVQLSKDKRQLSRRWDVLT